MRFTQALALAALGLLLAVGCIDRESAIQAADSAAGLGAEAEALDKEALSQPLDREALNGICEGWLRQCREAVRKCARCPWYRPFACMGVCQNSEIICKVAEECFRSTTTTNITPIRMRHSKRPPIRRTGARRLPRVVRPKRPQAHRSRPRMSSAPFRLRARRRRLLRHR